MRTPICSFDAKIGMLCPKCEAKLKGGQLTKADVEISFELTKLTEAMPELKRISLVRGVEVDGDYILVLAQSDLSIRKEDPSFARKLENRLKRKVWLMGDHTSERKVLEDLFYPVKVAMVNVVWLPDGSRLTKIIIPGKRAKGFPVDIDRVKKIASAVKDIELLVEFEQR